MKIKDEKTGEEIEVFTAEEAQGMAKTAAEEAAAKAIEDYKAANPDKSQEIDELKKALDKKEEDLAEAIKNGGNENQIKRLTKERDDAKKASEESIANIKKEMDDFKKEIMGDTKEEIIAKLSKGDAELRKKIELEFDNYRPGMNSKKDITERMLKAYQLATGNKPSPNLLDSVISMGDKGDGGGYKGPTNQKEFNSNEKAIGNVLGITDEDRANYEKNKGNK